MTFNWHSGEHAFHYRSADAPITYNYKTGIDACGNRGRVYGRCRVWRDVERVGGVRGLSGETLYPLVTRATSRRAQPFQFTEHGLYTQKVYRKTLRLLMKHETTDQLSVHFLRKIYHCTQVIPPPLLSSPPLPLPFPPLTSPIPFPSLPSP